VKLSKKSEYALRALIDLAMNPRGEVVQIHELASKENIPVKFLEQILLNLKNAGILQSRRGICGGYALNRPADQITLGQVIRLMDGSLAPLSCTSKSAPKRCSCPDEATCGLRSAMLEVYDAISGIVDKMTLADVCERTRELKYQTAATSSYAI
jgi:Rrf2 family protein